MTINEKIAFINEARIKRQELIKLSKSKEELELLKKVCEYTIDVYGEKSNVTIDILNEVGGAAKYVGEYNLAINSIVEARNIIKEKFGDDNIPYATTTLNLAEVYRFKGEIDKLLVLYQKVKEIYEKYDMYNTYEYASICNNLGLYYQDVKDSKKALELHLISYEILKNDNEHELALATTMNNLALAYRGVSDIEKSDEYIKKALKLYEKTVGKGHSMYSAAINSLASSLYLQGDLEKSLELFEKGLFIVEASFGTNSINYIKMKENVEMVKDTINKLK
ncbi:tetratricopeptide repeat protein [Oceanivirga miroungae]|uniref:Uncharacterized protein n=1 Tax=Oceanivirga miroungae TaxID=1130046 RepID=A0A6I8MF60_9FUSO|nr:tetratricopeptide repeat protein [Oceanivirga miroungae]VWL85716.1 hypothetical protein OMES3154_01004 [Oceanivirga miroungae]